MAETKVTKPAAKATESKPVVKATSKPAAKAAVKPAAPKASEVKETKKETVVKTQKTSTAKALTVKVTDVALPKTIFAIEINEQAVHDTIISDRASKRQGTHKVKHRGEVAGGGKKPWRQKGTGNARAGSTRGPIWVGGGVAFGPEVDRNYSLKINKKVRHLALKSALTDKANNKAIIVIEELKMEKPSTQTLLATLEGMKLNKDFKKYLIVTEDSNVFKSARNTKHIDSIKVSSLSVEQIVNADVVLLTKDHIKHLEGLGKK